MKGSNFVVKLIISMAFILACVVFFITYIDTTYPVEQALTASTKLDAWTLENSVLNGTPLSENKQSFYHK